MRHARYAAAIVGLITAIAQSPAPASPIGKTGAGLPVTWIALAADSTCTSGTDPRSVARPAMSDNIVPQASRASFARLLAAADAFGRAVAANEIDRDHDSCRAPYIEADERRLFLRTLADVLADRRADSSLLTLHEADRALNAAYRNVMAVDDPQSLAWGSVDKAGIRRTERASLAYRDAFVAFAATLDQPGAAERLRIELTARRATSLEAFLAD